MYFKVMTRYPLLPIFLLLTFDLENPLTLCNPIKPVMCQTNIIAAGTITRPTEYSTIDEKFPCQSNYVKPSSSPQQPADAIWLFRTDRKMKFRDSIQTKPKLPFFSGTPDNSSYRVPNKNSNTTNNNPVIRKTATPSPNATVTEYRPNPDAIVFPKRRTTTSGTTTTTQRISTAPTVRNGLMSPVTVYWNAHDKLTTDTAATPMSSTSSSFMIISTSSSSMSLIPGPSANSNTNKTKDDINLKEIINAPHYKCPGDQQKDENGTCRDVY